MVEVVAALIWRGDRFLICQRPAHKARGLLWEFVGGKVEPGETGEQALVRECAEELGIEVSVGDAWVRFEGADTLLAFPWSPSEPFPMIPIFRLGAAASIGGRDFMVFRLRDGAVL